MKIPAEVMIRQEELRRARKAREEVKPPPEPRTRTMGDDCAAILEAWWKHCRNPKGNFALLLEEDMLELQRKMRALGSLAAHLGEQT